MRWGTRRAEAFAAVLDDPTLPRTDEDEAFVALVAQLGALDVPEMRPDFASDLRARLVAEVPAAATAPVRRRTAGVIVPTQERSRRRRLVPALAVSAVLVGTATAVGVASQNALPGDTLYPVKRLIEQVELALSNGDRDEGNRLLEQARTRLGEIRDLTERDGSGPKTSELVNKTLDNFRSETSDGAGRLVNDYREHETRESIRDIRDFTASSMKQLGSLVRQLAPTTKAAVRQTVETLRSIDSTARSLCAVCSNLPPLEVPDLLRTSLNLPTQSDPKSGTHTKKHQQVQLPAPGKTHKPGTGGLPTVGGGLPTGAVPTGGNGGGNGGGGGGQPTGGGLPITSQLPSLPVTSVLPSVSLPTLPLPSLPLPSIPGLP